MLRPLRISLLVAFALVITTAQLRADYAGDFKNGVTAFDRKRWAEAARLMRAAIAANPRESSQKILIYGTRYVEYTPHLYLAAASARLNDCASALPALEASEQQGIGSRVAIYRETRQAMSSCAGAAVPTPQPAREAAPPSRTEPAPVEPPRQPEPRVTPPQVQPEPPPVQRPPMAVAVPQPTPAPPTAAPTTARPEQPRQPEVAGVKTVDRRIVDAVRAYVRGDYGRVLSTLQSSRFDDEMARTQAALFRAAARYALFLVGGGNDTTLRRAAVADVREYRRLSADPPDARVFAPPFRRFYAEAVR